MLLNALLYLSHDLLHINNYGFDGGKAAADKRGWSFTFEADSPAPMIIMGTPIDIDALFTGVAPTPPEGGS